MRLTLPLAAGVASAALLAALTLRPSLPSAHAADGVATRTVDYKHGDVVLKGYLARPEKLAGPTVPAVLVCHDWYGCADFAKKRAESLAAAGFIAFALDMYGGGKTAADDAEAKRLVASFYGDPALMAARAKAGLDALLGEPGVDKSRVAAIGFCFGGSCALQLARSGADFAGVVSFHGGLKTTGPAAAGAIKAKILVLHGGAEVFVPPADVAGFMEEMNTAKATWRMEVYGGAVHAFTNPAAGNDPSKGAAYDVDADRRSKAAQDAFFAEIFAKK
jgi:dienelactone hydrolase